MCWAIYFECILFLQSSLCFAVLLSLASSQIRPSNYRALTISPARYQAQYTNGNNNEGRYYHDDSGAYQPDGSGAYVHQDNPYDHQVGPNGANGGNYGGSGGFGPAYRGNNEKCEL